MDFQGFLTQQCLGMAALISAKLKGGGDAESNSGISPLTPLTSLLILSPLSSSPSIVETLKGALTLNSQFLSLKLQVVKLFGENFRSEIPLFVLKNLTFCGLVGIRPVLGLGNVGVRGFKPHSDKTQAAIGNPDESFRPGLGFTPGHSGSKGKFTGERQVKREVCEPE